MDLAFFKKALGVSLAAVLITPFLSYAAPPIKANSSCTKKGISKISAGKKYTCVQKGKKLVWKKGVAITIAAPDQTPSSMPSPTVSVIRTIGGKPLPDYTTIELRAISEMEKGLVFGAVTSPFIYHWGPNIEPNWKAFFLKDMEASIGYWSKVSPNPAPFNVFQGSQKDLDWLIDSWKQFGLDQQNSVDEIRERHAREGEKLNAGFIHVTRSGLSHFSGLRSDTRPITQGDYPGVAHEVVHIIQFFVSGPKKQGMPCWLREGSANLFGSFLTPKLHPGTDYRWYKDAESYSWRSPTNTLDVPNLKPDEWLELLKSFDEGFSENCDYVRHLHYSIGMFMSELLMAEHGFDAMMNWWRNGKTMEWRAAFQAAYGLDLHTWYKDNAVPYLMAEFKRLPTR